MRILYVTDGFPYPLTRGHLRHYYLIRELANRHEIVLCSSSGPDFEPEHLEPMRVFTAGVRVFQKRSGTISRAGEAWRKSRKLFSGILPQEYIRQMTAAVYRERSARDFDVVVFSGKEIHPVLRAVKGLPVIVDLCDASSVRIQRQIQVSDTRLKPWLTVKYLRTRRFEQELIRHASHVTFAARRDRDDLLKSHQSFASVIPNGVDVDYWQRTSPVRQPNTVIFTGGMNYAPNHDAALFLIQRVLPLVRVHVPDTRMVIVGRDPLPGLLQAAEDQGVTVTGMVEDVRPYIEQATVFAAPLRFGAGIQNKLLEALSMQIPVTTTPLAAGGLHTETGEAPPIHVTTDPVLMADWIRRQFAEWHQSPTVSSEGRQFVSHNFNWRRSAELLEDVLMRQRKRMEQSDNVRYG